ncbi:MAG: DUF4388 domain-containing protein [Candidatus Sericytochromatia bacterium]|nr:DUF4388 domain-containing protein [Candidatus Tanganyikabacteria bacterium]
MIPEGSLSEFSLPDLLQIISMEAGTGTLRLAAPGRQGTLEADGGVLIGAQCGPKVGEEAVYALFLWEDGAFRWEPGSVGQIERNVGVGLDDLTREGIARRDKWRQAKQTLPSLNAIYRRKAGAEPSADWPADTLRAWEALETGFTIGDLGRRLELTPAIAAAALIPIFTAGALDAEIPETEAAWMLFRKALAGLVGRFTDISGLRMTESMESFLAERGVAHGLDLIASGGRLLEADRPAGEFVTACKAALADVTEYMARLHGASFVERVVADVVRDSSQAEQAAAPLLGLGVPASAGGRAEGD